MGNELSKPEVQLRQLSKRAMHYANMAYTLLVKDNFNEAAVVGYVNAAYSLVCTARSIYISNIAKLEHNDIDEFFCAFEEYVRDVLGFVSDKNSECYPRSTFENLKEKYDYSVLSQ